MTEVVGVDVGGTRIKAVLTDADGAVLRSTISSTPPGDRTGEVTAETIARIVADLGGTPDEVGLAVPGTVDERAGKVIASHNLGWTDVPIQRLVADAVDLPVHFGHDVRSGALAEAKWGAARCHSGLVAFVPVGTGISAAFAGADGHLARHPLAGEFGTVRAFRRPGQTALVTLEQIAGGPAIARAAGRNNVEEVVNACRAGDPVASQAWATATDALAQGLAWLIAIANPDAVVVGGGVSLAGDALFVPLRHAVTTLLTAHIAPPIVPAVLGEWAGARGATLLGRRT